MGLHLRLKHHLGDKYDVLTWDADPHGSYSPTQKYLHLIANNLRGVLGGGGKTFGISNAQ